MGSETSCGELVFLADALGGGGGAEGRLAILGIPVEETAKAVLGLTDSVGLALAIGTVTFGVGGLLGLTEDF